MFQVGLKKSFIAQHYLIGGDWGKENSPHSHHFCLELIIAAKELDQHGYVADIAALETSLDTLLEGYSDQLLNDLEAFEGRNPSIEVFASILHRQISRELDLNRVQRLCIKLWEDEQAWASYEQSYD